MDIITEINKVKKASITASSLKREIKDKTLNILAKLLRENNEIIIAENSKDLEKIGYNDHMADRMMLNKDRIYSIANNVEKIANLPDPIGNILQKKIMENGLIISKISVPFGVVAVIYESRPNVTIDVFSLCFKSGNACILKGGKEAYYSNNILLLMIRKALEINNLDPYYTSLLSIDKEETTILLQANNIIDVCIPRGSQNLINFVRQNSTIPVIETGAGIVHLYFDYYGDAIKAKKIINNAKNRRATVCNALDCLIIHKGRLSDLYDIIEILEYAKTEIFADEAAYNILSNLYPANLLFNNNNIYGKEFLSNKMSIKTVSSIDEAIEFITCHTSKHSEAIITENIMNADNFTRSIDAAVIYINASTAFTDGGEFGMGAEIGISTQKLHARGPMGLEALTSYKWIISGDGQIRS